MLAAKPLSLSLSLSCIGGSVNRRRLAMTRRCSHCSNDGHNSRTCPSRGGGGAGILGGGSGGGVGCRGGGGGGGVKLFGVTLTDGSIMKKSASMGNLSHYQSSSSAAASPNPTSPSADPLRDPIHVRDGYLSDEPVLATCSFNRRSERKKGVPWTEEEHRMFLVGLQKLGKGEWRGIARNFVVSRTPTQVASHAQKYFIRKSNGPRRKRRSSLFDMVPNMTIQTSDPPPVPEEQHLPQSSEIRETNSSNPTPPLDLSLKSEFEPMDTTPEGTVEETEELEVPSDQPTVFPAYIPVSFPLWLPSTTLNEEEKGTTEVSHEVLKPTPVLPKEPVDEVAGMSQLSLGGLKNGGHIEPSPLSLQLLATPSRPSAFHVNASVSGSDISDKSNAIQAI